MFKFELTRRLDSDFGKISKTEIREFMAWAAANEVPVRHEFRVQRSINSLGKRPAPEGEEPGEGINAAKRSRSSFDEPQPEGEDVENFALRYVNKCSRHLNFVHMMFPCQICDRMNQSVDVCFTHGVKSCEICFPRGEPDGVEEQAKEAEKEEQNFIDAYPNRCNICKMRGHFNPACGLCAEIADCIDDLNKEQ